MVSFDDERDTNTKRSKRKVKRFSRRGSSGWFRSDPLSGQYEFKFVALRKPYLIFTYDSDEDFNAVILGPVYPTLMPQFEGIVKP